MHGKSADSSAQTHQPVCAENLSTTLAAPPCPKTQMLLHPIVDDDCSTGESSAFQSFISTDCEVSWLESGNPFCDGRSIQFDSVPDSSGDESPSEQLCQEFSFHSFKASDPWDVTGKPFCDGLSIHCDSESDTSICDESPSKQLCQELVFHSFQVTDSLDESFHHESFDSCYDIPWDVGNDLSKEGAVNIIYNTAVIPQLQLESITRADSTLLRVDDNTRESLNDTSLTPSSHASLWTPCCSSPGQTDHAQAQWHVDTVQKVLSNCDSSEAEVLHLEQIKMPSKMEAHRAKSDSLVTHGLEEAVHVLPQLAQRTRDAGAQMRSKMEARRAKIEAKLDSAGTEEMQVCMGQSLVTHGLEELVHELPELVQEEEGPDEEEEDAQMFSGSLFTVPPEDVNAPECVPSSPRKGAYVLRIPAAPECEFIHTDYVFETPRGLEADIGEMFVQVDHKNKFPDLHLSKIFQRPEPEFVDTYYAFETPRLSEIDIGEMFVQVATGAMASQVNLGSSSDDVETCRCGRFEF
jgi:hypothetical protein